MIRNKRQGCQSVVGDTRQRGSKVLGGQCARVLWAERPHRDHHVRANLSILPHVSIQQKTSIPKPGPWPFAQKCRQVAPLAANQPTSIFTAHHHTTAGHKALHPAGTASAGHLPRHVDQPAASSPGLPLGHRIGGSPDGLKQPAQQALSEDMGRSEQPRLEKLDIAQRMQPAGLRRQLGASDVQPAPPFAKRLGGPQCRVPCSQRLLTGPQKTARLHPSETAVVVAGVLQPGHGALLKGRAQPLGRDRDQGSQQTTVRQLADRRHGRQSSQAAARPKPLHQGLGLVCRVVRQREMEDALPRAPFGKQLQSRSPRHRLNAVPRPVMTPAQDHMSEATSREHAAGLYGFLSRAQAQAMIDGQRREPASPGLDPRLQQQSQSQAVRSTGYADGKLRSGLERPAAPHQGVELGLAQRGRLRHGRPTMPLRDTPCAASLARRGRE